MEEKKDFVKNADKLAGFTTFILILLGIIQILLGEIFLKSVALTANGIDCIGDGFVSGVVWIGLMFFKKPANDKFHYGYYKMENLGSIAAAIIMIILATYIVYRSYFQFINPHKVSSPIIGAFVALFAALIAVVLGLYKFKKGKKSNMGSVKLEAFNTIKDGVASGLTVVALIFDYFGYYIADAVVGIMIAGIIVTIGFAAIKESSYMLIDACNGECIDRRYVIKKLTEEFFGADSVKSVRLRRSGPIHLGEIEVKVSDDMTIRDFNIIKKKIIDKIRSTFPDVEKLTISAVSEDED